MDFCTATGTSRALPLPMPMRPSPSPTTLSAAKLMVRPPLTTLLTRLTPIIFSRMPSSRSSAACRCALAMMTNSLELQTGFTRGCGQCLHTAVKTEARAVECDCLDARLACFLGHTLADDAGSSNVAGTGALVGQGFADFGLERGSADEHAVAFRRNDGCVNVLIGAEHRKPVHTLRGNLAAGSRSTTQAGLFVVHDTSLPVRLLLLGLFENHAFVLITYALALVGFGATEGAEIGRAHV